MAEVSYYEEGYYEEQSGFPYYETITVDLDNIVNPPLTPPSKAFLVVTTAGPETNPRTFRWSFGHTAPVIATSGVNEQYAPVIESLGTLEVNLSESSELIGKRLIPRVGTMQVSLNNDFFDTLFGLPDAPTHHDWHGRPIEMYKGDASGSNAFDLGNFDRLYKGLTQDAGWNTRSMTIEIKDSGLLFEERPILDTYAGTGGEEGDANLTGKPKPLCFGFRRLVTPTLVVPDTLIYQVHSTQVLLIQPVYDRMLSIQYLGDIAALGLNSLTAWDPIPGTYITDHANGRFRLGAPTEGRLTCDVRGDNVNGYVDRPALIMRRLVERFLPDVDIDSNSFDVVDGDAPGETGLFMSPDDGRSLSEVLDTLAIDAHAWWQLTRDETVKLTQIPALPGTADIELVEHDIEMATLRREPTDIPAWRIELLYQPIQTVHTVEELDNVAIPASSRTFATNEFRLLGLDNNATLSDFPNARTIQIETGIDQNIDAIFLGIAIRDLHTEERHRYRCTVKDKIGQIEPGQIVNLNINRLNLPRNLMVLGVVERWERNRSDLLLWG